RTARDPDILEEMPKSVVSKRTLEQIANAEGAVWQSNRPVKENVRRIKSAEKAATKSKKKTAKASAKSKRTKPKSRPLLATAAVLREPQKRARSNTLPDF